MRGSSRVHDRENAWNPSKVRPDRMYPLTMQRLRISVALIAMLLVAALAMFAVILEIVWATLNLSTHPLLGDFPCRLAPLRKRCERLLFAIEPN